MPICSVCGTAYMEGESHLCSQERASRAEGARMAKLLGYLILATFCYVVAAGRFYTAWQDAPQKRQNGISLAPQQSVLTTHTYIMSAGSGGWVYKRDVEYMIRTLSASGSLSIDQRVSLDNLRRDSQVQRGRDTTLFVESVIFYSLGAVAVLAVLAGRSSRQAMPLIGLASGAWCVAFVNVLVDGVGGVKYIAPVLGLWLVPFVAKRMAAGGSRIKRCKPADRRWSASSAGVSPAIVKRTPRF
jgi:hypothetical protein